MSYDLQKARAELQRIDADLARQRHEAFIESFRVEVEKASGRERVSLLLGALHLCDLPPWLRNAFDDIHYKWRGLHVDSLDEAAGLPFPKKRPARRQTARRREKLLPDFLSEVGLLNHIGGWVDWRALSMTLGVPADVLKDLMGSLLLVKKAIAATPNQPWTEASVDMERMVHELTSAVDARNPAQDLPPGERWASAAGQAAVRTVLQALQGKLADVQMRRKTRAGRTVYWEDVARDLGSYRTELEDLFTKKQLSELFPSIALRKKPK